MRFATLYEDFSCTTCTLSRKMSIVHGFKWGFRCTRGAHFSSPDFNPSCHCAVASRGNRKKDAHINGRRVSLSATEKGDAPSLSRSLPFLKLITPNVVIEGEACMLRFPKKGGVTTSPLISLSCVSGCYALASGSCNSSLLYVFKG